MEEFGTGLENAIIIATTKYVGSANTANQENVLCVSHFVAMNYQGVIMADVQVGLPDDDTMRRAPENLE